MNRDSTSEQGRALAPRAIGGGASPSPASAVAALAGTAERPRPDNDLAYLRLLVAAELLAADFQAQALASGKLQPAATACDPADARRTRRRTTRASRAADGAGQTPATSDDIDFTYPKGSFASQASILKLAARLEHLSLGAYLGAVESVETPSFGCRSGRSRRTRRSTPAPLARCAAAR